MGLRCNGSVIRCMSYHVCFYLFVTLTVGEGDFALSGLSGLGFKEAGARALPAALSNRTHQT